MKTDGYLGARNSRRLLFLVEVFALSLSYPFISYGVCLLICAPPLFLYLLYVCTAYIPTYRLSILSMDLPTYLPTYLPALYYLIPSPSHPSHTSHLRPSHLPPQLSSPPRISSTWHAHIRDRNAAVRQPRVIAHAHTEPPAPRPAEHTPSPAPSPLV